MIIKEMANYEKPRERLLNYGAGNISNEELLAIIIRTGTKRESSKIVATKILSEYGSVENLKDANIENLKNIKGVGLVKAIEIMASIELGKRVYNSTPKKQEIFNNTTIIFNEFKSLFIGEKQEVFYALYFDSKQKLLNYKLLFKGTLNCTTVHPREIFKEAFLLSASSIIVIHNHPSGDVLPSVPDVEVTKQIEKVSNLMGIKFLDHIIMSEDKYFSFYEDKMNKK